MRDPDRIKKILDTLERAWTLNPELRLGQLIVNAARPAAPCPEVFYIEDDKLLDGLLEFEKRGQGGTR